MTNITSSAVPLNGTIYFTGNVIAYSGTNGTGSVEGDFTTAKSLVFSNLQVFHSPTGSFSNHINNGDAVILSLINLNPAALISQPLWTIDGYKFISYSISQPVSTQNTLALVASGIISDGNAADDSTASWTATFGSSGNNISFSCSSTASGKSPATPKLNINVATNQTILSWPTNAYNYAFSVQSNTNVASSNSWTTLTNTPVVVGTNNVISNLAVGTGPQYFRLIH